MTESLGLTAPAALVYIGLLKPAHHIEGGTAYVARQL